MEKNKKKIFGVIGTAITIIASIITIYQFFLKDNDVILEDVSKLKKNNINPSETEIQKKPEKTVEQPTKLVDFSREEFKNRYFKPVRANTWNVIVKSLDSDYKEAEQSLNYFLRKFPSFYFRISATVAKDGYSNPRYAIFMGNGLSSSEADFVVSLAKKYSVANDAYKSFQNWDTNNQY